MTHFSRGVYTIIIKKKMCKEVNEFALPIQAQDQVVEENHIRTSPESSNVSVRTV